MAEPGKDKKVRIYNAQAGIVEEVDKVIKSDAEWKKVLAPGQFRIMRQKGTEKPSVEVCGVPGEVGFYQCAGCGTDLFSVTTKFESGTGWPSFWQPVSELNIREERDRSYGMERIEVLCNRCDAHLGHLFNDGPSPTGKRYCINAVALNFVPVRPKAAQKATFAAGCFWGVEEVFRTVKGVISTRVGYTGGKLKDPTYKDVCTDKTGHAEAVEVQFDPSQISYENLLEVFWATHDPTTMNRQGPDVGSQYRSAVFYNSPEQEKAATALKDGLQRSGKYQSPIVTQIVPAGEFYEAEDYHQRYYQKRGMKPSCHIPFSKGEKE